MFEITLVEIHRSTAMILGLFRTWPEKTNVPPTLEDECFRIDCLSGEIDIKSWAQRHTYRNLALQLEQGSTVGVIMTISKKKDALYFTFTWDGKLIMKQDVHKRTVSDKLKKNFNRKASQTSMDSFETGRPGSAMSVRHNTTVDSKIKMKSSSSNLDKPPN